MPETPKNVYSIADFARRIEASVPCAGNLPVSLDDPDCLWYIEQGSVNLFLVEFKDGIEQAAPKHLESAEATSLLPGVAPDEQDGNTILKVVAKGSPGTFLKKIPAASLAELNPAELASHFNAWVAGITKTLSRYVSRQPRPTTLLEAERTRTYSAGTLAPHRGVVWVTQPDRGAALFMDIIDPADLSTQEDLSEDLLPLSNRSWLSLLDEMSLTAYSTEDLLRREQLLPALGKFHKLAFKLERLNRQLAVVDEANLERAQITSRRTAERDARQRLFNIYDLPLDLDAHSESRNLQEALDIIGDHCRIKFKYPSTTTPSEASVTLIDVLNASGVRARSVELNAEEKWWRGDSNALLAFRRDSNQPVVLLPKPFGHYREIDPVSKRERRLNAQIAEELSSEAWVFYAPLPSGDVEPMELLRAAVHGSLPDVVRLVLAGFAGGLIKLLPAIALGYVANHIVAGGTLQVVYVLAITLVYFGLLGALLHVYESTAMIRFEGRSISRLEAAFWDGLMKLPPSSLRAQSSGELAMSGMAFQNLRDGTQGAVADSFLSVIFLLPVFGVIAFYDTTLALVTLGFSTLAIVVSIVLGLRQINSFERTVAATRRVTGKLFQIISGVLKLRVEGAEGSAFALWARDYRQQKQSELELGLLQGHSKAFGQALPFLAICVFLYVVLEQKDRTIPIGDFLVAYAVFMTFQHAIARFGESFGTVAGMLQGFQQMRPILTAMPASESEGDSVRYLGGELLFDRVSFRYDPDGPLILDDVTFRAQPGEFVAIAGESGTGKSTLFRLALGLDHPTAGAVYYDGRDLRHLNLKQLRRHIGAVPQSIGLHPQDIWDNVVTHHEHPDVNEVWRAAKVAKIDEEIKSMPMGMMTMVGTSGSVLSGGEAQRITVAASVLGNPKILLLDEATNWLDNENQNDVMQNLTSLTSTRIVIAHRLSTLEQADRIYVLQGGKVVQVGSFQDLMAKDGVFKNLVRRQVV